MKSFKWNQEKNEWLKINRKIGFEDIVLMISEGFLIDIVENPRYLNQQILIINFNKYIYLVPFVVNDEYIFLQTIIPSRKATKKYLRGV
ncbi:MAG: hypothetical protein K9H26_11280 [Prolixibacteraceae bacterium]|nr:hypothetical protein [Prolixibacteraceae bacterium]